MLHGAQISPVELVQWHSARCCWQLNAAVRAVERCCVRCADGVVQGSVGESVKRHASVEYRTPDEPELPVRARCTLWSRAPVLLTLVVYTQLTIEQSPYGHSTHEYLESQKLATAVRAHRVALPVVDASNQSRA